MSTSQSKIEQRRQDAYKRRKQNVKRDGRKVRPRTIKRIVIGVVAAILVIVIAVACFFNSALARRVIPAVTVGDTKISVAEYNYYYNSDFISYYNAIASYFGNNTGIDMTKPLTEQEYTEGLTYAEYFSDQSINSIAESVALYDTAMDAGYTINEEDQATYDQMVEAITKNAEEAGLSEAKYIEKLCGKGFTVDMYKNMIYRELIASGYQDQVKASYEYTEEDLEKYYQEHQAELAKADFRYQGFMMNENEEAGELVTIEEAKQAADDFMAQVKDEASYAAVALALERAHQDPDSKTEVTDHTKRTGYTRTNTEAIDENVAGWVYADGREAGDVEIVEKADGTGYYVLFMVKPMYRDDYRTRDVRHILFAVQDTSDEEAMAEAKKQAEDTLAQWQADGSDEDAFADLAKELSADTSSASIGGLCEDVYPGEMVSPFDQWVFDDSRKTGDVEIVETEYGYHIIYFVGEADTIKWQADVENKMRDAEYEEWFSALKEEYPAKTNWLGIKMRIEPIG